VLCGTREKKVEELRKKMMNRNLGSGHHGYCELEQRKKKNCGREEERERESQNKKTKFIKGINVNSRAYVVSFQNF
jgi:hypothetical protein